MVKRLYNVKGMIGYNIISCASAKTTQINKQLFSTANGECFYYHVLHRNACQMKADTLGEGGRGGGREGG